MTVRMVRVIRETYRVEDDGHGGSEAVEIETDTTEHVCTGDPAPFFESPAREAVGIIRREYLSFGADGGDWFGHEDARVVDYGTDAQERTTAHLHGWTAREESAIVRMVAWLDRRGDERAREYAARGR